MKPEWLAIVVEELRSVSSELLEPGLAKVASLGALGGHGTLLRGLLNSADAFTALLPRLLSELDANSDGTGGDWRAVKTPRQARLSTAPQDYVLWREVATPIRWLRFDAESLPDVTALRWALHVCARILEHLNTQSVRLQSQLEEALLVRAGESEWARRDAEQLRSLAAGVQQRIASLRRAEAEIKLTAGRSIVAALRGLARKV